MDALFKKKGWLLPVTWILFLLTVIVFPFAAKQAYADNKESPSHTLTYTTGNLVWDRATGVDAQTGAAELNLFSSTYQSVEADNGDKIIAPGTEGKNIVRLKNNANHSISYIAVLYRVKKEDTLPVQPTLEEDTAFTDAEDFPLPAGVTKDQVMRAVTGTVDAAQIQDFDVTWLWKYDENDERDQLDTALGNKAAWDTADDVTAGLYIVVVDDFTPNPGFKPVNPSDIDYLDDPDDSNDPDGPGDINNPEGPGDSNDPDSPNDSYTYPQVPQTGDSNNLSLYLALMGVSGVLLLIILLKRRKEKRCQKG